MNKNIEAEEREWQALDDNMDWMSDDQIEQSARQIKEKYHTKCNEPCERCKGEGTVEKNIPGNEGVPEQDVMIVCPDCGGSGEEEDIDDGEYDYLQSGSY